MSASLFATVNYRATALRVGATVEELFTGKSVYFQPGDDTASLRDTVAALEEVDCEKRAMIFDMAMSNYF